MNKLAECVRCHVQMQFGFVLDGRHDGFAQQTCSPGEPEPRFWMGLKLKKINSFRSQSFAVRIAGTWNHMRSAMTLLANRN
jgi:hypothetical protein